MQVHDLGRELPEMLGGGVWEPLSIRDDPVQPIHLGRVLDGWVSLVSDRHLGIKPTDLELRTGSSDR